MPRQQLSSVLCGTREANAPLRIEYQPMTLHADKMVAYLEATESLRESRQKTGIFTRAAHDFRIGPLVTPLKHKAEASKSLEPAEISISQRLYLTIVKI